MAALANLYIQAFIKYIVFHFIDGTKNVFVDGLSGCLQFYGITKSASVNILAICFVHIREDICRLCSHMRNDQVGEYAHLKQCTNQLYQLKLQYGRQITAFLFTPKA